MMNLLFIDFIFFLPIIISIIMFFGVPILIVVLIVKASKKNIENNQTYNDSNDDGIGSRIKKAINNTSSSNICEYCGSDLGKEVECPNCGAKLTKKK